MQNTKNSKEVQGTGTAQEQLSVNLTEKTKKLLFSLWVDTIKKDINQILLGWISGDAMEYFLPEDRTDTFSFYLNLILHLEKVNEIIDLKEDSSLPTEFFEMFTNLDKKKLKNYFDRSFIAFLETDFANEKVTRLNTICTYKHIRKYVKSVCKILRKNQLLKTD